MRKIIFAVFAAAFCIIAAFSANAAEPSNETPLSNVPYLEEIEFENAVIDGGFVSGQTAFSITLDDPDTSPRLRSYKINGDANIFVTYNYDNMHRQTGVYVTLSFESGSVIYTFNYSNARDFKITDNADLSALSCDYGEVQPAINSNDTVYKLYIPSDLTQLNITPVTADTNAYCYPANISMGLNDEQEPELSFTVNASDGSTKMYEFKVRRIDKTIEEVKLEMAQPDYVSFARGELFYQRPAVIIASVCAVAGVIILFVFLSVTRRIIVNPRDKDEKPFYSVSKE